MSESLPAKAQSVDVQGQPDGFVPPTVYEPQVIPGGFTRLQVSVGPERLEAVHRALIEVLTPPLKFLYVQLTERQAKGDVGEGWRPGAAGHQLARPRHHVAVELSTERVLSALASHRALVYHDGRHQLWVRGAKEEQVVLEEIGVLYAYPDDPLFRETLQSHGIQEGLEPTLAVRDYIRVNFVPVADEQEADLMQSLGLVPWSG